MTALTFLAMLLSPLLAALGYTTAPYIRSPLRMFRYRNATAAGWYGLVRNNPHLANLMPAELRTTLPVAPADREYERPVPRPRQRAHT